MTDGCESASACARDRGRYRRYSSVCSRFMVVRAGLHWDGATLLGTIRRPFLGHAEGIGWPVCANAQTAARRRATLQIAPKGVILADSGGAHVILAAMHAQIPLRIDMRSHGNL